MQKLVYTNIYRRTGSKTLIKGGQWATIFECQQYGPMNESKDFQWLGWVQESVPSDT